MRQFIHNSDGRTARQTSLHVHLFERHASVLYAAHRHTLQISNHRPGLFTPVGLDHGHDNVHALPLELMRVFQHLIGLADARSRADVNAQGGPLAIFQLGEQ